MEELRPRLDGAGATLNNDLMSYEPSSTMRDNYMNRRASESETWWNDPEAKRKRRVLKYKLYSAEGKLKYSLKQGFRWLKIKCIKIVNSL